MGILHWWQKLGFSLVAEVGLLIERSTRPGHHDLKEARTGGCVYCVREENSVRTGAQVVVVVVINVTYL